MGSVFELEERSDQAVPQACPDQAGSHRAGQWVRVAGTAPRAPGNTGGVRIDMFRGGSALRVAGDIDYNTSGLLAQALERLPAVGECHLYLSDVDFISVAGVALLVQYSDQHTGGRVILHSPPRSLLRIASIGWPGYRPDVRP